MVKHIEVPKKLKGVRAKSLKRVTNTPSMTSFDDMNDDCLTSVFDYLDTSSLVKMTKTNQRLKQIVTDRVIPLKTVQLDKTRRQSSSHKVFKLFGPTMTRLSIDAKDIQTTWPGLSRFSEFLRLLAVYGVPGRLQQLTISGFEGNEKIPEELLVAVRPYFENVHTLTIDLPEKTFFLNDFYNQFMSYIPKHNLRHLYLHNVRIVREWLSVELLPNLKSFHLCMTSGYNYYLQYETASVEQLLRYIRESPKLTTFDYVGRSQETINVEVSRHIPNIARIGTIRNLIVDQSTDPNNNDGVKWNGKSYRAKWKYLNEFTNLKQFSLESHAQDFNNCGEIFRILGGRNTVEHLELISGHICQNGDNPVEFNHVRQMTNVKSLHFNGFGRLHSDEFVGQLFENLIGLNECTIVGTQIKQAPIINLVENGRNLRFLNMPSISSKFYRKLVKVRRIAHPDLVDQPLVIRVPKICADACESELKPTIITIKPSQS